MQGKKTKKHKRGGVARVGVAPKEKGVKGVRGSPKALILGQIGQRSRAVLGALSAGAKLGRSGWGVAYALRALMSPPFLWNCCNVPQHDRDANAVGVPCEPPPERASKKIIASTATLAWMKSTSFFLAASWMSAIGLKERTDRYNLLVLTARSPTPPTEARPSNQPARPVRRRWTVRPSAAGRRAAAGLSRLLRLAPIDAGPIAG